MEFTNYISKGIHAVRHSFARCWILNGGDAFRLQRMLGHSTLAMTNEYLQFFGTDMHRGLELINPLERMKGDKEYIRIRKRK